MKEIWQLAISPGVLPATLLLIPILLYWIVGALGVFNLDLDGVDPSAMDANGDGVTDHHDGVFANVMGGMTRLVNAQDIPLMVILTLITLFLWSSLMISHFLFAAVAPSWMLAIASLVASIVLTRLATIPLRPFFLALKKDSENHVPVVGRSGVVRTHELTDSHGQIEVPDPMGPMLLNARVKPGVAPLRKGDEVIVFEFDSSRSIYYVKSL